jgi:hypothetical protein
MNHLVHARLLPPARIFHTAALERRFLTGLGRYDREKPVANRRSNLSAFPVWFELSGLAAAFLVVVLPCRGDVAALDRDFRNPPETTKPRCYWYWFDDHVSKEGITRDLEAMKRVGIGGAYIGLIGGAIGKRTELNPVPLTEPWWENLEHALREGTRLGVDIGLFNCPGWSQSGGPWVKPHQTMRYLVQEEIRLQGPQRFTSKPPVPAGTNAANFQSVALLAFPAPEGDDVLVPVTEKKRNTVRFAAAGPITVRSLVVQPREVLNAKAELLASDDGKEFRPVRKFTVARTTLKHGLGPVSLAPVAVSFPAVTARFFRLDFITNGLPFTAEKSLGEIRLSPAARVEDFAGKALLKSHENSVPPFDAYTWPPASEVDPASLVIDPSRVVDLTGKVQPDGSLVWDVPPGKWILQHVGMVPTGTMNKPASPGLTGFEVDKMNRQHLATLFNGYVGELMRRLKPEERKSWKYIIADSYETGLQNWTDGLRTDFQRTYGYDPQPYLPSIYGRVVGSADATERFLWDLRRLVAERIACDYVGGLRDLTHAAGMKLWLENYGHFGFPSEFLLYGAYTDEVSGEFWLGRNHNTVEIRAASSAARIYGKSPVWAEAFTARNLTFQTSPRDLKAQGDWAFCQGINQFVLHVYIHQPDEQKPGFNAWFGTEFNRHNTWFEQSKSWIDYQRRCSVLLQAGQPVADFAVFVTEDAPKMTGPMPPPIPSGHDYDFINADAILNRLEARDGRLVLPGGNSYAAVILPDTPTMRPAVARKIRALADAGAKIIGSKPTRSPSLQDYPDCDAETRRFATWDALPDAAALALSPDVLAAPDILWTHRRTPEADIYFMSNQSTNERTETISFRLSGRPASLWNPVNVEIQAAGHTEADGRSSLDLRLPPLGSVFVVFGPVPPGTARIESAEPATGQEITGPWQVAFPDHRVRFEALVSWPERPEQEIKFHSGRATYSTEFQISNRPPTIKLDLGRVESLATVTLNGKTFPTLWTYPYQVDVTSALKTGRNELSVEIANNWQNRLVGDARLPKQQRRTVLTHDPFKAGDPLQPAGLLGPVRLMSSP